MIDVLIADDSPTARELLAHILGSDPEVSVIGTASNGREVLQFLAGHAPDVITMDIQMPEMDGLEATRRIMETTPIPVVIVSGLSDQEKSASFRAFEAGALAAVMPPHGIGHPAHAETAADFVRTVKAMAGVKLVRRWPKVAGTIREAKASTSNIGAKPPEVRIVGVGASTGGPAVLKTIIGGLPQDFSVPVVLVQHMSAGFLDGFADWLARVTGKRVRIPSDGEMLMPGVFYLAPENVQMAVSSKGIARLDPHYTGDFLKPSVSYLFRSLASSYGAAAVGVLLTGMGRDGADSLKLMKERGAVTIAQSADTCVVKGMPMEAVKLGAIDHILPPEKISAMLRELSALPPE